MKEKGILFFTYGNITRPMHYIYYKNETILLTEKNSSKVSYLTNNSNIFVKFSLLSSKQEMKATIIEDTNYVKEIFEEMLRINHTHFKVFDRELVVLKITA